MSILMGIIILISFLHFIITDNEMILIYNVVATVTMLLFIGVMKN